MELNPGTLQLPCRELWSALSTEEEQKLEQNHSGVESRGEAEGNWTESQNFCSSHDASLARIESLQELDSLLPYQGRLDHWIGLQKDQVGIWRWVNGTEFNHRFGIGGGADCALLDEDLDISSSDCNTLRKWLCT